MDYPDSVEYLYALGNEVKSLKFGLEGIRALLEALGNPQDRFKSVHVAGTNGKGSTCVMIAAGLQASGRKTGLFTSPHLIEPTERIQIDGKPISRERFSEAFDVVHEAAERLLLEGRLENHTTYFETVTAMAFLVFAEENVAIAVVEVGLGGRLDATNVLRPELCVITPIDFDHEAYLGNRLELIAAEKAGILKAGVPAVFAAQRPEAARVLEEKPVPFVRTSEYVVSDMRIDSRGSEFTATRTSPVRVRCPLAGRHQVQNAVTAIAALELLQTSVAGIAAAKWPGRLERIRDKPELILDGAHNPAGAGVLAAYIVEFYAGRKLWLIYGAMRDKSVQEITRILFPLAHRIIVTAPQGPRAVTPETLAAHHPEARVARDVEQALRFAGEVAPEDVILLTGSLYLVGEARALLVH